MKQETHLRIFKYLIGSILLLPLVFYSGFLSPFGSTQTLLFVFFAELLLPYYLFLLHRFPHLRPDLRQPFVILNAIFFGIITISALFGVDPWNSFWGNISRTDGLFVYYHLFLFYFYLQIILKNKQDALGSLSQYIICISGLTAVIGIFQSLNLLPSLSIEFGNRVSSTLGNPIFFASSLVIPFFFSISFALSKGARAHKIVFLFASIILLFGILVSGSRGVLFGILVGLLLGFFLWIITSSSKTIQKRAIIFLLFSTVLFITVFFTVQNLSSKPSILYRLTHFSDANISSRLIFWNMAVTGWTEHPWLGVGHQNFYRISETHYQKNLYEASGSWPDKVHNVPLEVLATGGIFALLFFLAIFAWSIKSLWTNSEMEQIEKILYTSALTAFFIQNCFAFDTIIALLQLTVLFAILNPIQTQKKPKPFSVAWPITASIVVVSICVFFLLPTTQELKLLRSADAKMGTNNPSALEDLKKAKNLPFIFDLERIGKQVIILQKNELGKSSVDLELSKQMADLSISIQESLLKRHSQKAYVWYLYATSLNLYAYSYQTSNPESSFEIANKIIQLAPNRSEGYIVLSNLYDKNGDLDKATFHAEQAVQIAPTDAETLWNLAYLYLKQENIPLAAEIGLKSVRNGLKPTNTESLNWLINYFVEKQDHATVVYLYERAVLLEPNKTQLLPKLAAAYALNGQIEKAIETANTLKQKDPASTKEVDIFIRSIQK